MREQLLRLLEGTNPQNHRSRPDLLEQSKATPEQLDAAIEALYRTREINRAKIIRPHEEFEVFWRTAAWPASISAGTRSIRTTSPRRRPRSGRQGATVKGKETMKEERTAKPGLGQDVMALVIAEPGLTPNEIIQRLAGNTVLLQKKVRVAINNLVYLDNIERYEDDGIRVRPTAKLKKRLAEGWEPQPTLSQTHVAIAEARAEENAGGAGLEGSGQPVAETAAEPAPALAEVLSTAGVEAAPGTGIQVAACGLPPVFVAIDDETGGAGWSEVVDQGVSLRPAADEPGPSRPSEDDLLAVIQDRPGVYPYQLFAHFGFFVASNDPDLRQLIDALVEKGKVQWLGDGGLRATPPEKLVKSAFDEAAQLVATAARKLRGEPAGDPPTAPAFRCAIASDGTLSLFGLGPEPIELNRQQTRKVVAIARALDLGLLLELTE